MPLLTPVFAGGSFSATRDLSVNFGAAADRGLLVLVFSEGRAVPEGASITSCVIDPAGANVPLTAGVERDSAPIIAFGGWLRAFWVAGASVPTGVRTVRVTLATGNGKPQVWALPFDGFSAVSGEVLSNGSTANPTIAVPSAAGRTVVAMLHAFAHPDGATMTPNAPATVFRRVLLADNAALVGGIWQEAGAASTVVDGTWTGPNTVWGVVGWSLTPAAGGGDATAPTLSSPAATGGTLAATGSVSTNEGNGTLYTLVSANATEAVPAQGQPMTGWSSQAVTAVGAQNVSASGLTAGTRYMHFVHDDAAGNRSTRASSAAFTVAAGAATFTLVCARMANNTGAGKKVSTTFTGTLVYGGHFNDLVGKTMHPVGATNVNADGDASIGGLPQTGAALLLRRWADGALSAEFVNVA